MNDNSTFTNTESIMPEKTDLEDIATKYANWQKDFVANFKGLFIKVDDTLIGNQYYIAVSSELYKQIIEAQRSRTAPSQVPESPVEAR